MKIKACPIWIPDIVYVILLGVTSIGFIAADVTRDEIERQDVVLKADTKCMQSLRSIVYPLSGQIEDAECSEMLKKLAEEFKYSDPVSSDSIKDIEQELTALVDMNCKRQLLIRMLRLLKHCVRG